jgi:hypothetical protein
MAARDYHKVWLALIALAVAVEVIALRRTGTGDTMSEWVWSKISQWPLRAVVAALLFWLAYHFIWAGPGRFTRWDLVSVLAGIAFGLAAFRWGWR